MKKPETLNNYPVVLMHGAAGWGESEWLTKLVPYFGFFKSNVLKLYRGLGYDAFVPTSGPFTGSWVRACDLYAQVVGGRTDYGKAYSERTGCERYGRTYPGLIPDWGRLDENGKIKKICLISHSYGAPAMRVFISLLAYGSEEERAVTPENELSDLFKGGKENWVHAATTLAGVHNGLSLVQFFPNGLLRPLWGGLLFVLSLLFDYVGIAKRIWDMKLDAYKLTTEPGKHTSLKDKLNGAIILGKEKTGSMAYDTSFDGA
ncbi:MAG: lipase, partial [Clostridia bacterium]|nr:lipase [Clostridia bacterium]